MTRTRRLTQGAFALAFAASLGFGARQATAAPQAAASLRACDFYSCYTACRSKGWFSGKCSSTGVCVCTPRP